ncbi:acetyl-CoA C-acyltransferase [Usitatibacter palustris]|uniref:3-ketoacyl-CoA thiolase FadI n=1 Tax=Usitatibacter palustris TaxID=2732487 RepID=A0A6M4H2L7_9PROT|nr:acetyl-CoA C-acyltransferase [Usitatibacter palustris]QJR13318.1 3-ketoacyl-CoA thiolase FadI [Usitatibacter palustris]
MNAREIFLVPGVRTPFTRVDGALRSLDAVALSVPVAKAMAGQLTGDKPDFLVWGTVAPNLGWSNIAREVLIDAGMDQTTPAFSTVLACSTSMVGAFEAAGMLGGTHHLAMVGGVESMSRVQIGLKQGLSDWIRRLSQARSFGERVDRFLEIKFSEVGLHVPSVANRATGKSMGEHCEEMAKQWRIARTDQDRIAYESHARAVKAMANGFFDDLIVAVGDARKDGIPRADSTPEKLASLKPAFDRTSGQGTITAGNASPLTDGAAAIWVATEEGAARLPAGKPRARLVDWEMAAVDIFHEGLLMAPAYAIPRLLARRGLTLAAIDLWEIHEAFAAQVLCNVAALESEDFLRDKVRVDAHLGKFPWEKLNPNGGSVAIGHPFGATGARILSQAVKELAAMGPGKRAIVSICADGGVGTVALLES